LSLPSLPVLPPASTLLSPGQVQRGASDFNHSSNLVRHGHEREPGAAQQHTRGNRKGFEGTDRALFDEFQQAEKELSREQGAFTLFGLFERRNLIGSWDVVRSAPWLGTDYEASNAG